MRESTTQMSTISNMRAELDEECTNKLIRLRELELEKVGHINVLDER